jgi:glutamine synthetase
MVLYARSSGQLAGCRAGLPLLPSCEQEFTYKTSKNPMPQHEKPPARGAHEGFIGRFCPWSDQQREASERALASVREHGIRTVRLAFADQHGILRGKTIVAEQLPTAFKSGWGLTSTLLLKDTSHRTAWPIWSEGAGMGSEALTGAADFVAVPDPTTFRILPWAPHSAWVLCDGYFRSGEPVPFATRQLCARELARLGAAGYDFLAGIELEFHIYRIENAHQSAVDCAQPGPPPSVSVISRGFQYLTESRYDEIDPILDALREALLALEIPVRSLEIEFGPSQCELTFDPRPGLAAADMVVLARSAIKQICRRRGLLASFMCRPALAGAMSSGWHLHQSLIHRADGRNAFVGNGSQPLSDLGMHFVGGLLRYARETCLLSTPTINGYKRYRPNSLAPNAVVWGQDNRGAMLRVIGGPGDPASHVENRVGESAANPYLYFLSQVVSGLAGIEERIDPGPAENSPYAGGRPSLPSSLVEAVAEFRNSTLLERMLGRTFLDYLVRIKEFELHRFLSDEVTDWEQREYFEIF